ncbi:MAG: ribosome silencing factor [Actinomycetota bacterium]
MRETSSDKRTLDAVKVAVAAAEDKQAENIQVLDMRETFPITDYFIVMSGSNTRKLRAIAGNVEAELGKIGLKPYMREGTPDSAWILLDYIDFVLHIFRTEEREFYQIERLWKDAPVVKLTGEA